MPGSAVGIKDVVYACGHIRMELEGVFVMGPCKTKIDCSMHGTIALSSLYLLPAAPWLRPTRVGQLDKARRGKSYK